VKELGDSQFFTQEIQKKILYSVKKTSEEKKSINCKYEKYMIVQIDECTNEMVIIIF
jgi:hypothetical protein